MRFLLRTARKDLARRASDPVALLIWVGIPVAIGVLWGLAVGGDGGPTARVLVVDRDSTLASRLLVGAADRGPAGESLDVREVGGEAAGRRRIGDGEGTALLVIPEGFGSATLGRDTVDLTLVTNPSQRILPGVVREGASMLTEAIFYLQEIAGPALETLAEGPPDGESLFADGTVAELAADVNRRLRSLEAVLFPPVLSVDAAVEEGREEPEPGFGVLFLPGLVLMSVMLVAQGMSDDLWAEEEAGTLERVLASPHGAAAVLGGKLAAGVVVIAAIVAVALGAGAAAFAVPASRIPAALLWCSYAGAALLALFFLLQTLASGRRGGNLLTTLVVFPLLMIGGSFFPFEAMPGWMTAVGRWTPNGLAVVQMKALLFGTPDPVTLIGSAVGIGAIGAVAFAGAARRARRLATDGRAA